MIQHIPSSSKTSDPQSLSLDRDHSPGRRTLEGHQRWAVGGSLQRVRGLGGLRQGAGGRLGLWGWLPWPGAQGRASPSLGVLLHPPSMEAPPRQINLANVVVHCRVIQKIQDQQHQHEKAIDPHSQQGSVIAGEKQRETERGDDGAPAQARVNQRGWLENGARGLLGGPREQGRWCAHPLPLPLPSCRPSPRPPEPTVLGSGSS